MSNFLKTTGWLEIVWAALKFAATVMVWFASDGVAFFAEIFSLINSARGLDNDIGAAIQECFKVKPPVFQVEVKDRVDCTPSSGWLGAKNTAQECAEACKKSDENAQKFVWAKHGDKNCKCAGHYCKTKAWNNGALYTMDVKKDETAYGSSCMSPHGVKKAGASNQSCGQSGEAYDWCVTHGGWDYCQKRKDTSRGWTCKRSGGSGTCGQWGKSYTWCYTTNGAWDYCVVPALKPKVSTCEGSDGSKDGDLCTFPFTDGGTGKTYNACTYDGTEKPWCFTKNDGTWGYCRQGAQC